MGKKGRSGNGEDSYSKLPSGSWRCQFWVTYADGTQRRMSRTAKRKHELRRTVAEARRRARGFGNASAEKMTVEELVVVWMKSSVRPRSGQKTADNYERQLRNHIVPALGAIRLSELSQERVQSFCHGATEGGLKPSTVRHIHAVLRAALAFALQKRLISFNPALDVSLPQVEVKKSRILSSGEVERFLAAAHEAGDRHLALYHVAFFCGLRIGEILGLHWRHVELEARELRVRYQMQRLKGRGLVIVPPKRDQQRTVPFGDRVLAALVAHAETQREMATSIPGYEDRGLVFPTTRGTPLDPQNVVNRSYKPLLAAGELPPVTFHSTRHSFATTLLERHVDIGTVSVLLGHQDVATTLRFYGHVVPKMTRHAAGVFDLRE